MNGPDISNLSLVLQLLLALAMVSLTTLAFGFGLVALSRQLGIERNLETRICVDLGTLRGLLVLVGLIMAIFLLHVVQISLYALLYFLGHALPTFAKCVYFSAITYGTVGYDSMDMPATWQIVGAVESLNGVILLGWSTAFVVTAVSRISRHGG